jgi:hypothetical protein
MSVGLVGDMETPKPDYTPRDGPHLRQRAERDACEAALLDAISKMSFPPALHEHVRCQSEYEDWQRKAALGDRYPAVDSALQEKSLQSVAATRFAARACGRYLRAEGVEPGRMVILVKQVVECVLHQTRLERPDDLRMRILTWAIEGYYGGD